MVLLASTAAQAQSVETDAVRGLFAAIEYAEWLAAQDQLQEARDLHNQLSGRTQPHAVTDLARRLLQERADPAAALGGAFVSSQGYDGQRRVEWSEARGRVLVPGFSRVRQTLELSGSSLAFSNGVLRLPAYTGGAATTLASGRISIDGSASFARGERNMENWEGHAAADVTLRRGVDLRAGVERTALLENLATVRDGLAVWGPTLSAAFVNHDTEVIASGRVATIAGNVETTGGLSIRQRVRRGLDELHLVGVVNHTGWRQPDVRFFSPESFTRTDAGMEWTRALRPPRFQMDRKSSLTMRYLVGVDSDGEVYHQPSARLVLEHRRVGIDAEAAWISSPVYRSVRLQFGVRVGG
jgi:hypothetical protein